MSWSGDKQAWRERNVAFLRQAQPLWQGTKLKAGYIEMIGESGYQMFDLLEEYLFSTQQFIGVDHDIVCIFKHRLQDRPFRTVFQDAFNAAAFFSQEKDHPVGIFNFDTFSQARRKWWFDNGRILSDLIANARKQFDTGQACAFILNHCIDRDGENRPAKSPAQLLADHGNEFWAWANPWRKAPALPGPFSGFDLSCVDDRTWTGRAGVFEVYQSENKTLRMATLRFWIDANSTMHFDRSTS